MTFDGSKTSSERLATYISGELGSLSSVDSDRIPSTSSPLYLGSLQGTNVNGHNGLLDDVRIYNQALSAEEIALFTKAPPNYGPEISLNIDSSATLHQALAISANVNDDGLPQSTSLAHLWSSPGVTFSDASAASSEATFPAVGKHTLKLSAFDGDLTTFKTADVDVAEILVSYNEWASEFNWQGRDAGAHSHDNVYRIPNLILYAMDLNPTLREPGKNLPAIEETSDESTISFSYRRNKTATSIIFRPQSSGDLSNWIPINASDPNITITVLDPNVDGDGSAELIKVEMPRSPQHFFRLHAENE